MSTTPTPASVSTTTAEPPPRDAAERRRRGARWEQLSRGVQIPAGLAGRDRLLAELIGYGRLLPGSGVWSGLTALQVHGVWLPELPPALRLSAAMGSLRGEVKPERPRLVVTRHPTVPRRVSVGGIDVQAVPEALRSAACALGWLDLVVAIDGALHEGLCSLGDLHVVAAERRRGVRLLRAALPWCDGRSESPWESLLRLLHTTCGIDVVPQHELRDPSGRFAARGDLWIRGTRLLQEYDGAQHRTATEHARDLERERRIADAGGVRRGYIAADVLQRPHVILRAASEALGMPRPPALDPWLDVLGNSLRLPSGRRAFLRRAGLHTWT